jgi:predicted RNase H-like HicB family nuclease
MEQYLVVIGKTRTGYGAHCPDVLGCVTVGDTPEECISNMKEALDVHFEGTAEDGDPIPMPGGTKTYRDFMSEEDSENYLIGHVQINTAPYRIASKKSLRRLNSASHNGHRDRSMTSKTKKAKALSSAR